MSELRVMRWLLGVYISDFLPCIRVRGTLSRSRLPASHHHITYNNTYGCNKEQTGMMLWGTAHLQILLIFLSNIPAMLYICSHFYHDGIIREHIFPESNVENIYPWIMTTAITTISSAVSVEWWPGIQRWLATGGVRLISLLSNTFISISQSSYIYAIEYLGHPDASLCVGLSHICD